MFGSHRLAHRYDQRASQHGTLPARLVRLLSAMALSTLMAFPAAAEKKFPTKPISIVVPSSPGSPSDTIARMLAKGIEAQAGSAVVVEDRPGANGIIGTRQVARAEADGHTILFTTMSPMVLNRYLFKSLNHPGFELTPKSWTVKF